MKMDKETFRYGAKIALDGVQGVCFGFVTTTTVFVGTAVAGLGVLGKHPGIALALAGTVSLATNVQMMLCEPIGNAIRRASDRTADKLVNLVYKD